MLDSPKIIDKDEIPNIQYVTLELVIKLKALRAAYPTQVF